MIVRFGETVADCVLGSDGVPVSVEHLDMQAGDTNRQHISEALTTAWERAPAEIRPDTVYYCGNSATIAAFLPALKHRDQFRSHTGRPVAVIPLDAKMIARTYFRNIGHDLAGAEDAPLAAFAARAIEIDYAR